MKTKVGKRFLAVLLSIMMLLGCIPATVLAAGDDGISTLAENDIYVQNVLPTGETGELIWYPDDDGIMEIPVLDREIVNSTTPTLGIKITGAPNYAEIDFSAVEAGMSFSINASTGRPTFNEDRLTALKDKVAELGSVDIPIVAGILTTKPTGITLRFVNRHDNEVTEPEELEVYYTPAGGTEQLVADGDQLTIPVPEDQNGGTFSYTGLTLEDDYWCKWETSNDDGKNMDLPIYFEKDKLIVSGAATVTVSLNKYKGYDFNNSETVFSCEVTAESDEVVSPFVEYENSDGNTQKVTEDMPLYLQKGSKGSLQVKGVAAEGFTWNITEGNSVRLDGQGNITADNEGKTSVSLKISGGEPVLEFEVWVVDLSVTFKGSSAGEVSIEEGDTLSILKEETGTFSTTGAENLPGVETDGSGFGDKNIAWVTEQGSEGAASIATYSGALYIRGEGTVKAYVVIEDWETMATSVPLCSFTITVSSEELEAIKVKVHDQEINENDTVTVKGSEYTEFEVLGKYTGKDEYVPISDQGYTVESDDEILNIDLSESPARFFFSEPGEAKITIDCGKNSFTFKAESEYVAVESLKLKLPETVYMHTLVYGMGNGENYTGIPQASAPEGGIALGAAYEVVPANASYARDITWSNDNQEVAEYMDTHSNGFIGHKAGTTTITAEIDQGEHGKKVSASQEVTFAYQYPVEELKTDTPDLTVETGKKENLDIQFTPTQPSQGLIEWSQEGTGEVEVQRGKNDEYAKYSNLKYSVRGVKAGTVTLTGTPVSKAEGKDPTITFNITVTGEGGETPGTDTAEVVKGLKESAQKYYDTNSITWAYGQEWNVIALSRAGLPLSETDKQTYLESVKAEVKNPTGKLTEDAKPTDIARVIMALYSLGENPRDFADTDLLQRLMASDSLNTGSNEAIWALLALDAVGEKVPEGSSWTRDTLIEEILEYQCEDGSFALSKSAKAGSIDMTAMALQALAAYQDKENVKTATDKALKYLKDYIDEGDYGTVESDAQVAIALLMLDMDPCEKENGFAEDDITIYQAMEQYIAEEGGFKHYQDDKDVNEMSTQQVLLAIAAWERYSAGDNLVYDMTDVASAVDPEKPENPDEPIGYVTVAVEKFSIGQGYLIEPEIVPIYKDMSESNLIERLFGIGENSTAAEMITQCLEDHNLKYEHSGTVDKSFYLAAITDNEGSKTANFPESIIKYAEENKIQLKNERKDQSLGEFDYSSGSGWKYTVNDDMTEKGMSEMTLKDGDVVRVSFTAIDYGQDLGNKDGTFMPVTNRDELTKMLAEINSAEDKDEILTSPNVMAAYKDAVQIISNLENDQKSIDAAADRLQDALDNPDEVTEAVKNVIELIKAIGDDITLDSKEAIEQAREAYNALSEEEKQQVGEVYDILDKAEKTYQELEDNQKAAQIVIDKINSIGEVMLDSGKTIEEARKAYDALTEEQKELVTNLDILKQAEDKYAELNKEYLEEQKEKAKAELDAYKDMSEYAQAQQEELKAIIEQGKKAIDEAESVTDITSAKEAAMKKMDEVKTREEIESGGDDSEPVTLTNSTYMISVTGENLTEDMELQVVPLTEKDDEVSAMRKEIPSSKALIKAYEISILKDGKKVEEGPFTVSYQMDDKYNDEELTVFLVDSQGKLTELKGTVKDGTLSVTADTLGSMAVVVDSSTVSTNTDNNQSGGKQATSGSGTSSGSTSGSGSGKSSTSGSVKTGDDTQMAPFICAMLISAAAIGGLAIRRKRSGR